MQCACSAALAPAGEATAPPARLPRCPRCVAGRARAVAPARIRVEPKTFFANERTMLQWLQIRWGRTASGSMGTCCELQ